MNKLNSLEVKLTNVASDNYKNRRLAKITSILLLILCYFVILFLARFLRIFVN